LHFYENVLFKNHKLKFYTSFSNPKCFQTQGFQQFNFLVQDTSYELNLPGVFMADNMQVSVWLEAYNTELPKKK